jgi:hypothetical protein
MSALDLFVLFGLPLSIIAASFVGVKVLNKPERKQRAPVKVDYDFSNVIRHPAVNE